MTNPIVHFELPADDVERAQKFYTKTFGWEIKKVDMPSDGSTNGEPYYMVYTTEVTKKGRTKTPGAINGGLMKRMNPNQQLTNYIHVENVDKMLKSIEKNGGKVLMKKTPIGENMGYIALFKDPEGNSMGLHQM